MIAGFDSPTEGEIWVDGACIASPLIHLTPGPDRVVVFQHGALFPWRTVLENVCWGPMMQGTMSKEEAIAKGREVLKIAGLESCENEYPMNISSGMQRRVEIVRALVNEPKILLLDEPTLGLAPVMAGQVIESLGKLRESGLTLIVVEQKSPGLLKISDQVLLLRRGRLEGMVGKDAGASELLEAYFGPGKACS
jgi:NitT/TauT family transport system ATP-binding protein